MNDEKEIVMRQVTAAIMKEKGKYLICQRSANDSCPLLWEFPGGKQEEGETLEECIIREIKEELELEIRPVDIFATSIYEIKNRKAFFTVFNVEITGGEIKLNVHDDMKWVYPQEFPQYEFMPADIVFVEKILKDLS